MFSSKVVMSIRSGLRKMGVTRLVGSLWRARRSEDRFWNGLKQELRVGDTVWDVGANVGVYTEEFEKAVGASGLVIAFEPVKSCYSLLAERFAESGRVRIFNVAVGSSDGDVRMRVDADALGTTHRVLTASEANEECVVVDMRSATSIVRDEAGIFPNVVKIDVEGHEGEVIRGMDGLLADRRLRCVGVEMHFGLIDARGDRNIPRFIELSLINAGFGVRWADSSHLIGVRK